MENEYTVTELRKLKAILEEKLPVLRTHGDFCHNIICYLKRTKCRPVLFRTFMAAGSRSAEHESFWWKSPTWIMMYETPYQDLPKRINVPVFGVIAAWRLRLGK